MLKKQKDARKSMRISADFHYNLSNIHFKGGFYVEEGHCAEWLVGKKAPPHPAASAVPRKSLSVSCFYEVGFHNKFKSTVDTLLSLFSEASLCLTCLTESSPHPLRYMFYETQYEEEEIKSGILNDLKLTKTIFTRTGNVAWE